MAAPILPTVYVEGRLLDPWRVVLPIELTFGRSDLTTQPDSNVASFEWLGPVDTLLIDEQVTIRIDPAFGGPWGTPPDGATGPGGEIWEDLWSVAEVSRVKTVRFTGKITDIVPVLENGSLTSRITCIGRLTESGNVFIGDTPWPSETEAARVARIKALCANNVTIIDRGNPGYVVAARDVDRQTALTLLQEMAGWTGALVWEATTGEIVYDGSQVRSNKNSVLLLEPDQIMDGVEWRQSSDRHVTGLTIAYGTADPQAVLVVGDGTSPVVTRLATSVDAQALSELIMSRWASPDFYDINEIATSAILCSTEQWDAVLLLEPGQVIETIGVSSDPSYVGTQAGRWYVEGWREIFDRTDGGIPTHDIGFSVSEYDRFRPPIEVPTVTTTTITPTGTREYGTARTVSTVVQDVDSNAVNQGIVSLYYGAPLVGAAKTVDANGAASWSLAGDVLKAGSATLTVRYDGVRNVYGASAGSVTVSVQAAATATTLTVSDSTPPTITPVTFTATVRNTGNTTAVTGSVSFQYSRNGGGWTTASTKALNGSKASYTWNANNPDDTWSWRAVFIANANHKASTSASVGVNPFQGSSTTTISGPSSVKDGAKFTLTGKTKGTLSNQQTPTGSIVFEYSNAGDWIVAATKGLDSNGVAEYALTAGVPSFNWVWRARYTGSTNTNPSTSASKTVDVTP